MKPAQRRPEGGTPAKADKRLWLSASVIAGLFGALVFRLASAEVVLDSVVWIACAYIAQSQAGLTMRGRWAARSGRDEG